MESYYIEQLTVIDRRTRMKWHQWWYFRVCARYIWEIDSELDGIADQLYVMYNKLEGEK